MKKALLLSVVASVAVMAGGDIAPVEPVAAAPAAPAAEVSGWKFNGQAALYYQTRSDRRGGIINLEGYDVDDMFSQANSAANVGIQLGAVNKNLFGGLGAGVELTGLGTLGLDEDVVSGVMQTGNGDLNSAAITQAYLTYGIGNTSLKVGRQQLPKALSPFAFSESWNVFKNTFEAALLVNTDITDTTLVYAYVTGSNGHKNLSEFNDINDDGVHMLTVQNKSVEGLTLTGTWYYAPDMLVTEDVNVLWGDAKFAISDYTIALQGGTVLGADDAGIGEDTTAFGAMVGAKFGMFDASAAFSSVDEGAIPVHNLGTGVKTPLYTQMILNQNVIKSDADYVKVAVGANALGGRFGVAYGYAVNNEDDIVDGKDNNPYEIDVTFKTKVFNDSTTLFAGYVYTDPDVEGVEDDNMIRVWARYNF